MSPRQGFGSTRATSDSKRSASVAALALAGALLVPLVLGPLPLAVAAPPGVPGDGAWSVVWWPEWLAAFDADGDLVDDAAQALAADALAAGDPGRPVPVMVSYLTPPTSSQLRALRERAEADPAAFHVLTAIPTVHATVPARRVAELGALPGVIAVEWDFPLVPALDISRAAVQAGNFAGAGANAVYNGFTAEDLGYTGENMVIAIADTGVNELHEAFAGKWINAMDVTGAPWVPNACSAPADEVGHGTHVASTALGDPAGKPYKGTAKGARLVEIKIGSAVTIGGSERAFQATLDWNAQIAASTPPCLGVSLDDRIDVVSLSFGSLGRGGPNAGSAEAVITNLANSGVAVTISAGNCGPNPSATCNFGDDDNGIGSPGNAAGSLSVANIMDASSVNRGDDVLAPSSSRGPNAAGTAAADPGSAGGATNAANLKDRYRKPDVGAPGTDINAADSLTTDGYIEQSGTSMAAPHMAGIAALLLQAGEEVKSQTGGINRMRPTGTGYDAGLNYVLGPHPLRDALVHTAEYRTQGVPAAKLTQWEGPNAIGRTWNNGWGYGEANVFAALCWAWANVLIPAGATATAAVNDKCFSTPPLGVDIGGPYAGQAGNPIPLKAIAAGGVPPYAYSWDLDNDATFGDASGELVGATFATAGPKPVAVRVTDGALSVVTASATVQVSPAPPAQWPQFHRDPAKLGAAAQSTSFTVPAAPEVLGEVGTGGPVQGGAIFGDIDGDGANELVQVVGTANGADPVRLNAYEITQGNDVALSLSWSTALPSNLPWTRGFSATPVLVESQDGDAGMEIAVSYEYIDAEALGQSLFALVDGDDGALLLSVNMVPQGLIDARYHPAVGNVDNDPYVEVVQLTRDNVIVWEGKGGGISQQTSLTGGRFEGAPALADLNGDGIAEVVAARRTGVASGNLYIINGANGALLKNVPTSTHLFGVAVADLDGDGTPEIVATGGSSAGAQDGVFVFDTPGGIAGYAVAATAKAAAHWNAPVVGDVTGDGVPDIVVVASDENTGGSITGDLFVFSYGGGALTLQASLLRPANPLDARSPGGPALVNYDADPALEIVFGSRDGVVRGYSVSAPTLVEDWSHAMDAAVTAPPMIVDVSGDGQADIAIADESPASLRILGFKNHAPVLAPVGDRTVDEAATLTIALSASDPDPGALTFAVANAPGGSTFNTATGVFTWTPDYDDAGTYPGVEFSVTDAGGLQDSETITITVANVNRAPVLAAVGNKAVDEGQLLQFQLSALDPDGQSVTYSGANLPAGASLSASGLFQWTPSSAQAGSYPGVQLSASDGELSASETITITVNDVPLPVAADFVYSPPNPNSQTNVQFAAQVSDPDNRVSGYLWTFRPGHTATTPNAAHVFGADGDYFVTLEVFYDGGASSIVVGKLVHVSDLAPTVDFSWSPGAPGTGQDVQFDGEASDPDGTIVAWLWDFDDGSTSTAEDPVHAFAAAGFYDVSLTVTDDFGNQASVTKIVVVCDIALQPTPGISVNLCLPKLV